METKGKVSTVVQLTPKPIRWNKSLPRSVQVPFPEFIELMLVIGSNAKAMGRIPLTRNDVIKLTAIAKKYGFANYPSLLSYLRNGFEMVGQFAGVAKTQMETELQNFR